MNESFSFLKAKSVHKHNNITSRLQAANTATQLKLDSAIRNTEILHLTGKNSILSGVLTSELSCVHLLDLIHILNQNSQSLLLFVHKEPQHFFTTHDELQKQKQA